LGEAFVGALAVGGVAATEDPAPAGDVEATGLVAGARAPEAEGGGLCALAPGRRADADAGSVDVVAGALAAAVVVVAVAAVGGAVAVVIVVAEAAVGAVPFTLPLARGTSARGAASFGRCASRTPATTAPPARTTAPATSHKRRELCRTDGGAPGTGEDHRAGDEP
jgi:hypothetical protein